MQREDFDTLLAENPDVTFASSSNALDTRIFGPDDQVLRVMDALAQTVKEAHGMMFEDAAIHWRPHTQHWLFEAIMERSTFPEPAYPMAVWINALGEVGTIGMSPNPHLINEVKQNGHYYGIHYDMKVSRFQEISGILHDAGYTMSSSDGLNSEYRQGWKAFPWMRSNDTDAFRYSFRLTYDNAQWLAALNEDQLRIPIPEHVASIQRVLLDDPNIALLSETCRLNKAIVGEILNQLILYSHIRPYFTFVMDADARPDDGRITDAERIHISTAETGLDFSFTANVIEEGRALMAVATMCMVRHGATAILQHCELFEQLCERMSAELKRIYTENHPSSDLMTMRAVDPDLYARYEALTQNVNCREGKNR